MRGFYENDSHVVPVPGTVVASSATEKQLLGPRAVVNGVTVRSSDTLEAGFKSARHHLFTAFSQVDGYLSATKQSVYEKERAVSGTVSSLHDKNDDVFPSIFYVAIASLAGNIMAQRRGLVSKAVFPVAGGLAAFAYFMPRTFDNTRDFVWKVEQRALPQLAEQQVKTSEQVQGMVEKLNTKAVQSQQSVHAKVESVRQGISAWTGLNIDEEVSKK